MDTSALETFISNYNRIVESGPSLTEADTKHMIINPLLSALGWEFVPDRIQSEYPVRMGRGTTHVDYCLKLEGSPVAFIEAKALGTPIDEDVLEQAVSYGRQEFVGWVIVTNGEEVVVVDSQEKERRPDDAVLFRFPISKARDVTHYLKALTPAGFEDNLLDQLADDIRSRRELLAKFSSQREQLGKQISSNFEDFPLDNDVIDDAVDNLLNRIQGNLESSGVRSERLTEEVSQQEESTRKEPSGFPTRSRNDLNPRGENLVAVFPANPEGINFLRRFNAWGFVSLGRNPDYCALYITKPDQMLRFIAPVKRIVDAETWFSEHEVEASERVISRYDPEKVVIEFEGDSPVELTDPIPWKSGDPIVQGLRYTTLESLQAAERVGDLQTPD